MIFSFSISSPTGVQKKVSVETDWNGKCILSTHLSIRHQLIFHSSFWLLFNITLILRLIFARAHTIYERLMWHRHRSDVDAWLLLHCGRHEEIEIWKQIVQCVKCVCVSVCATESFSKCRKERRCDWSWFLCERKKPLRRHVRYERKQSWVFISFSTWNHINWTPYFIFSIRLLFFFSFVFFISIFLSLRAFWKSLLVTERTVISLFMLISWRISLWASRVKRWTGSFFLWFKREKSTLDISTTSELFALNECAHIKLIISKDYIKKIESLFSASDFFLQLLFFSFCLIRCCCLQVVSKKPYET